MRSIGRIVSLVAIIGLIAINISYAGSLTLEDSFPTEGKSNLNPQNVAVKLIFSEKISNPATAVKNKNSFAIEDEEGKAVNFEPLYNEDKYPNEVWLQINDALEQNTKYKVTVFSGMVSDGGNVLEEDLELNFATRNTEADSKGYMMLMLVMVGGMMVFTVVDARRKVKKETAQKKTDDKVNPYKEAKKTGKSVEDIVAKTEKQKRQAEKKRRKLEKKTTDNEAAHKRTTRPGVKPVGARKSFNDLGYKTPQSLINKKLAREKAKEAGTKKTHQVKSKGSKQQQKKKK